MSVIVLNEDAGMPTQSGISLQGPIIQSYSGDVKLGDAVTSDYGWRDIISDIIARTTGGAIPTWSQISGGNFWAYKFGVGDECWLAFHINHDYAMGTAIFLHCHFLTDGTNVNPVKWEFTYTIAKGHNQSNFSATGTPANATVTPNGTALRHYVAEIAAPGISSAELEPDAMIMVRVKRVTNGATDNTDGVFVFCADLHYQASRFATKNKAPNFYTG